MSKGGQKLQSGRLTHLVDQQICWYGWCWLAVPFVVSVPFDDKICWYGHAFRINILYNWPILLMDKQQMVDLQNQHFVQFSQMVAGAQPDHTFPVFSNPSTYIVKCQQWLVFRINFLCICTNTRGWGGGVSLTVQCTFPLAHKDLIQSIQSNPIPSTYIFCRTFYSKIASEHNCDSINLRKFLISSVILRLLFKYFHFGTEVLYFKLI